MRTSYILLLTIVSLLWGQNPADSIVPCLLPFPQEGLSRQLQKPGTYKQYELNRQVAHHYGNYCYRYLKESESGLYVEAPAMTASNRQIKTTAEVHGVAMVTAALMANEDGSSRNRFDQLYSFYEHNSHDNGRMRARQFTEGPVDESYASGADLDIAYALLLAHCQWGSEGAVNYLTGAKELLKSVENNACNRKLLRLHPGGVNSDQSVSSSDLFRPSYFRAFAEVSNATLWDELEVSTYQLMEQFSGKSVTGFIPDFIHGETPVAGSGITEDLTSDSYSYAGRRLTLHLALDLIHNMSKEAQNINGRMAHWFMRSCAGDPHALRSGYTLSGQELTNYIDIPFIASSALAVSCIDSGGQLLDTLWEQMINEKALDAATAGEKILAMLLLSGNWWSPCGEQIMLSETTKSSLFSPHISLLENHLQVEGLFGSKVAVSFHTLRGQLLYKKRVKIYENKLTEDLTYTNLTDGFHLLTLEGEGFTVIEKVIVSR